MTTQAVSTPHQSFSVLTLAIAGAGFALGALVTNVSVHESHNAASYQDLQCDSLARTQANRSHSMLDGAIARAATQQALQTCLKDPVAFRNQLR